MEHIPNLTEDEAWDYCIREYENPNLIVKALMNGFFSRIHKITDNWSKESTVLEVGCGAARSSIIIHQNLNVKNFEASEFDERYVSRLQKEDLPFRVKQESVYEMKREDNSIDHLIMLEVLEHLEEPEKALSELTRVAKKSVLLSVPHEPIWCALNFMRGKYWKDFGNTPGHINHWNPVSFKKLLNRYGKVKSLNLPLPWLIAELEIN